MTFPNHQLPPQDEKAEQAVLGAILREPTCIDDIDGVVRPESFYHARHQVVFRVVLDLRKGGKPVDLVTVYDRLRDAKEITDVGGHSYLADLWESVSTGANVVYHAGLVRECAKLRAVIHVANEAVRDAYARRPADELIGGVEARLYAIGNDEAGMVAHRFRDVMQEVVTGIEERLRCGQTLRGLATGYADLDNMLGGLKPGELVVIGARPSVGKTAFTANLLHNIAAMGAPVSFSSLEQSRIEIGERILSIGSGVHMHKFSKPTQLTDAEIGRIMNAASDRGVGGCEIWIDDTPNQSAAGVLRFNRRLVQRSGVQVAAVDYLGLMRPENENDNKTHQIGTLALRMKHMARELNIPVLLLCQLNRDVERADRPPRLSDLRDSGEIEQHADNVLFLHRAPKQDEAASIWPLDVVIAKQRNGPVGTVTLAYRRAVMKFENYSPGVEP